MSLVPSAQTVRRALASHSWIGLLVGALMYVVCLSGTVAVLYPWLERWEQPAAPELSTVRPEAVQAAYARTVGERIEVTDHMYVSLPTERLPRLAISSEETGRFVNADGSLGEIVNHAWTHLLIDLHLYLHLPGNIGIIVVSILGALLCGLVISGLLAHPNIFRDAFSFRLGGSRQLEQTDIHNRLSVWGLPFHVMIGVTGAYFGLVLPMMALVSALSGTPRTEISASIFGEEPDVEQTAAVPRIGAAIAKVKEIAPESQPFSVTVHDAKSDKPLVDVYATWPGRLTWGELYRFDGAGNLLVTGGYADGQPGKQAVYSIYRLHFGHFGSWPVQAIYIVLGLALTVVSVTGVNIWLEKRRRHDAVNDAWVGIVWGLPAALTTSAFTLVILGIPSVLIFWLVVAGSVVAGLLIRNTATTRSWLQRAWAVALALLLAGHVTKFGGAALSPAAIVVNALLVSALLILVLREVNVARNAMVLEPEEPV
ncbi:MAG: PepSY-associated TM helix domain-containing protein [Gammaproteobacteria bacterium]|nr:PepSY-associated TM helix domain-containing protein [Gammaproteobacteria bacterium]